MRQKLDPIKKKILNRKNLLELVFENISTFDAENPTVGSLVKKLDSGKKLTAGDLVKKPPGPPGVDFVIRNRLRKIKERKNNTFPPPTPPSPSLLSPPPPPPPRTSSFSFNLRSPPPPPPLHLIKFLKVESFGIFNCEYFQVLYKTGLTRRHRTYAINQNNEDLPE